MDHQPLFSRGDTEACKGAALILLLWHHLFYVAPQYGVTVHLTARLAKVCVAIFVMLSGYGLAASLRGGKVELPRFYRDRLSGLYLNYWLIAAIFMAVGTVSGMRPVAAAYGSDPWAKLAAQMLGLDQYLSGGEGYNATWWFMGVIIPLYLLFPFLNALARRFGWWSLVPGALVLVARGFRVPVLQAWLFPFCLGIYAAQRELPSRASSLLAGLGRWRFALLAVALATTAFVRQKLFKGGELIDGAFGAVVVMLCFEVARRLPRLRSALAFLGRHLFNIFLFHTFVYAYFWPRLIYAPGNPLLILALLLGVCVAMSLALERVKTLIGFPRLLAAVRRLPLPGRPAL